MGHHSRSKSRSHHHRHKDQSKKSRSNEKEKSQPRRSKFSDAPTSSQLLSQIQSNINFQNPQPQFFPTNSMRNIPSQQQLPPKQSLQQQLPQQQQIQQLQQQQQNLQQLVNSALNQQKLTSNNPNQHLPHITGQQQQLPQQPQQIQQQQPQQMLDTKPNFIEIQKKIPAQLPQMYVNPFIALINDPNKIKVKVPVPQNINFNFSGLLIGPKGQNQKRLEEQTGCKILVRGKGSQKEGAPPQPDDNEEQHVLIVGDSQQAVAKAQAEVERIFLADEPTRNKLKQEQLKYIQTHKNENMANANQIQGDGKIELSLTTPYGPPSADAYVLPVPEDCVGLVIGKGGETIRSLQEKSGAKKVVVAAEKTQDSDYRNVFVEGTVEQMEEVKRMLAEIVANQQKMKMISSKANRTEIQVPVNLIGLVIGKQGDTIKSINAKTGGYVWLSKEPEHQDLPYKVLFISGTQSSQEAAKHEIQLIIDKGLNLQKVQQSLQLQQTRQQQFKPKQQFQSNHIEDTQRTQHVNQVISKQPQISQLQLQQAQQQQMQQQLLMQQQQQQRQQQQLQKQSQPQQSQPQQQQQQQQRQPNSQMLNQPKQQEESNKMQRTIIQPDFPQQNIQTQHNTVENQKPHQQYQPQPQPQSVLAANLLLQAQQQQQNLMNLAQIHQIQQQAMYMQLLQAQQTMQMKANQTIQGQQVEGPQIEIIGADASELAEINKSKRRRKKKDEKN